MTLAQLIAKTEKRFAAARLHYGHGTENAHDEAAFLVLRGLGLPFDADLSRPVDPEKLESLIEKRIKERIPVAYLLREAWLDGQRFYVDPRVIVPRSHIAELLGEKLRPWLTRPAKRVLDLCTGSGCLAILAAHAFPASKVDAIDLSNSALAVAAKNVGLHKLAKRVRLVKSDLFGSVAREKYDVIITNPPYVASAAMRTLPPEYRHEPGMALAAGKDGLDLVRRIIEEAPSHLAAGGLLMCEVGDGRKALERAYRKLAFTWPETAAGAGNVFVLRAPWH